MCYSALVKRNLDHLNSHYGVTIVREQIEDYGRASAASAKRFPPLEDRIYPGYYAPVIYEEEGKRFCKLMRYSAYPPPLLPNPKAYTTFNARRDNLTSSFWSSAFRVHHGFVVLEAFYEWVKVADLLKAGVVTIKQVEQEFAKQSQERKDKILAAGKKYKPTPTELKDPRFRQIVIEFKPQDGYEMLAPVIFNFSATEPGPDGKPDAGFALVTDDPPLEVSQAGHDRCPIVLEPETMAHWLQPKRFNAKELIELIGHKKKLSFQHQVAESA